MRFWPRMSPWYDKHIQTKISFPLDWPLLSHPGAADMTPGPKAGKRGLVLMPSASFSSPDLGNSEPQLPDL